MGSTTTCLSDLPTREVAALEPIRTLREMIGALVRHDVGLLVVVDGGLIKGVVSERDVIDAIYDGANIDVATVGDIVHTDVIEVDAATSVASAASTMLDKRVRHLLVRNPAAAPGELPHVVSIRDLVEPLVDGA